MSSQKVLLMNNGLQIPQLALGTYKIADEELHNVISVALSSGYRHLDCAWIYQNEKAIGQCLYDILKNDEIKRSELFITSKLWCSFHKFERVRQQCLITINDLQCQYLDLFLIHWPMAFVDQDPNDNNEIKIEIDNEVDFVETWQAMESLVDEGLVKSIGLSNFNEQQIERILQVCRYKPVVNQVEIHPYCPQLELERFCQQHKILLAGYASLGAKYRAWKDDKDPEILQDTVIQSIAAKYHVDSASVLLRYIIDRDIICVVRSSSIHHLKDNINLFVEDKFKLNDEDFEKIHKEIKIRFRYYKMEDGIDSKEHPFPQWRDSRR